MKRPTFAVAALLFALSGLSAQAAEITVLGGMGVVSASAILRRPSSRRPATR